MCGFINDIVDSIVDIVDDVVDIVVDVVDTAIGWLVPQPDIPEFGDNFAEQQAKGVLVNKYIDLNILSISTIFFFRFCL